MRWIVWIVGSLAVIVVLVTAVGYMLPKEHTASVTSRVSMPPDAVYALLSEVDKYPSWRPNVKSVSRQPDHDGKPAWTEDVGGDRIALRFERMERPSLLVSRIADPSLPFGGSWTYRIASDGAGSTVSITENGEVYNPIFRFMSRFVLGHAATLEEFAHHLEARAR